MNVTFNITPVVAEQGDANVDQSSAGNIEASRGEVNLRPDFTPQAPAPRPQTHVNPTTAILMDRELQQAAEAENAAKADISEEEMVEEPECDEPEEETTPETDEAETEEPMTDDAISQELESEATEEEVEAFTGDQGDEPETEGERDE